jgi:hypothetical protein
VSIPVFVRSRKLCRLLGDVGGYANANTRS